MLQSNADTPAGAEYSWQVKVKKCFQAAHAHLSPNILMMSQFTRWMDERKETQK